jgi:predicted metal-dependent peptidase
LLRIVIAIDTSGSINKDQLSLFLSEIESIMLMYPYYEIDLITADAKIQSHRVFLPTEELEYALKGGGGTDFRVVFDYIDQEISYPTLLLYFTDAMGIFPEYEPNYDVLWIMEKEKEIPFGEVLKLD